jgi:hypothetical protein
MLTRRSAPKEGDNVTAARDPGRVMAILYSRLATSLRSLAIILPIHLHLLSLPSTFATVSLITIRMPMRPNEGVRALTLQQIQNVHDITDFPSGGFSLSRSVSNSSFFGPFVL